DQDGHLRLNHPEEARWLIEALIEHPELYNDIETIELNEFCQETIEQHLEGYLREKPAATEEALYFASHQSWLLDFCLFSPS
ncbi:hypothetical protein HOD08_05240, partial [bacterium]|nr:hypothetical protein [bacterium]